jgi:hypothetical protein
MVSSKSASGKASIGAARQIPALLTRMSSRPKALTASLTACWIAAASRLSALMAMARPPAASISLTTERALCSPFT